MSTSTVTRFEAVPGSARRSRGAAVLKWIGSLRRGQRRQVHAASRLAPVLEQFISECADVAKDRGESGFTNPLPSEMPQLSFDGIVIDWESLRPELLRTLSALPTRTSVARQALAKEWERPDFYERWDELAEFFDRRRVIFGSLGSDAQALLEQLLADAGFDRWLPRSEAENTIRVALIEIQTRRSRSPNFYGSQELDRFLRLINAPECPTCAGLGRLVAHDEAAEAGNDQAHAN